jgi:mRNA-degrading endonuclease RelE of RelBE toxin-antitoxin system
VKSHLLEEFIKRFDKLPRDVQDQARADYQKFKQDPFHPSLHFKCIDKQENIWSTRVGAHYRAVGTREGDTILWFFIGTHADYDHLL